MTIKINPFQKLFEGALFASVSSFLFISTALAGPNGGQIEAGAGSIQGQGTNNVLIHQRSNRIVINWKNFNTAVGESVEFKQPNQNAIAINRINNGTPTEILGSLRANGQVIVINPNGVVLGNQAKIDVNKLVLSTADIATNRAMRDKNLIFDKPGNPNAKIINNGTITAGQAGLVGFIAPHVENNGTIDVKLGKAQLASGSTFTLDLAGDELVNIAVSDDVVAQLAANNGTIKGNQISITAAQARHAVDKLIINNGVIEATSVSQKGGRIILGGDDAHTVNAGVINVSGKSGGSVKIKGKSVLLDGIVSAAGTKGNGGSVDIQATQVMAVTNRNVIDVFGGKGGEILMQSPWLYSAGTYLAQGDTQKGGTVKILGDNLYLASSTYMNTSGLLGGGNIYVGGDLQGHGDMHTATTTSVERGALIVNDALKQGDGGQTIIWSDDTTEFFGNILARGKGSGKGGFTEVSGKQHLNFQGDVDLTSESGVKGTLLLDPAAITVYGNVDPLFVSTDGSVNMTTNLQLWLDASTASTITLSYSTNGVATTATGAIGTNTITTGTNVSANLAVGARIRLTAAGAVTTANTMGADTYTIAAISGTTITTVEALTQTYAAVALHRGLVSQWTDKSGANINATQGTVGNRPLWISSIAALNNTGAIQFFNGAQSYLDLTVNANNAAGGYNSVFFSMNWTGSANQMPLGFTSYDLWFGNTAGFGYNTGASNVYGVNPTTAGLANTWRQVQANFYNGTNANNSLLIDRVNQTLTNQQGGTGTGTVSDTMRISGWRNDTNYSFNGRLGEIILYSSLVSGTRSDLLAQYQTAKTGIGLNAPGTGGTENARATSATGFDVFTTDYLQYLSASADVNLLATNLITLDLKGDALNLANDRNISFTVTNGSIASASSGTITTNRTGTGGNISFNVGGAGSVSIGNITLNAQNGGTVSVTAGGAVTLGAINAGSITATSGTGTDLTLNGGLVATSSGNSVVLNAGRNFLNSGGSINPGAGRYLVYSANPANNAFGGISGFTKRYNKTFGTYAPGSVTETGNVFLYSVAPVLTVTANDATRIYGDVDPSFSLNYSGYIDGDTAGTAFSGSPDITPVATITTGVGTSAITSSVGTLLSALGYTFNYVSGTLTITPAALTVTAANQTKVYGDANPALALSYTGLKNSDVGSSVFTGYALGTTVDNVTGVGSYAITLTGGATNANYTLTRADGTMTVTPASLTVTALDQTKVYGAANPLLILDYNGLKNGEDGAVVFLGYALSTMADNLSGVGSYAISLTGGSAANYTVTNVDGTLSVTPAGLTITVDNKTKVAGSLNPLFTMSFVGLLNGDLESVFSGYTLSSPGDTLSPAGLYAINLTGGSAANYTVARIDGQLTIDPAPDLQPDLPYKQLFNPDGASEVTIISEEAAVAAIQSNCLYKIINFDGSVSAGSCGSGGK